MVKRKLITLILFCLLIFFIPAIFYAYPFVIDYFSPMHKEPMKCKSRPDGAVYCTEVYREDGLIMFSVFQSSQLSCCIFERFNISDKRIDYKVEACAQLSGVVVNCSKVEQTLDYGREFLVDGYVLTKRDE